MIDSKSTMVITPGRIAYSGPLGIHADRILGAPSMVVAKHRPFTIRRNGVVAESMLEVIGAHELHYICSNGEDVAQLVLEPETISEHWAADLAIQKNKEAFADRIHVAFNKIAGAAMECKHFDQIFFGRPLPQRDLDPRIGAVVERIRVNPAARHSAEQYAKDAGLSVSRFSHLFRGETGSTLRSLSAWKRARAVLALVKNREKLVETALEAGYADSTHFCHSIRQFYGLRPRDIVDIMISPRLTLFANDRAQPITMSSHLSTDVAWRHARLISARAM